MIMKKTKQQIIEELELRLLQMLKRDPEDRSMMARAYRLDLRQLKEGKDEDLCEQLLGQYSFLNKTNSPQS